MTELPKVLEDLLDEVSGMDESLFVPQYEINPHETIIGPVGVYARKLYACWQMNQRERDRLAVEFQYMQKPDRDESSPQLQRLTYKCNALQQLFWYVCLIEAGEPLRTENYHGIRIGWQLIRAAAPNV